jgi:hypothetical protein
MTITNKQFREYLEKQPRDKESWRLTKRMNRDIIRGKRLKAISGRGECYGSNYKKRRDVASGEHRKHKRFKRNYE